jgi:hypothetical protein
MHNIHFVNYLFEVVPCGIDKVALPQERKVI